MIFHLAATDNCTSVHHRINFWPRLWIRSSRMGLSFLDSIAYIKLCSALSKQHLVAGFKKASPIDQTSALEGFHSVVNQFSPKMISYSFPGMFIRYLLNRSFSLFSTLVLYRLHWRYNLYKSCNLIGLADYIYNLLFM